MFHQVEGLTLVADGVDPKIELLRILSGLVEYLFPGCEYRVNNDYFPFTEPSFEIEVKFGTDNDAKWLEILGCGVVHRQILNNNGIGESAFAFGLGLERLCMIACEIPDIRYFWSDDDNFLRQYRDGQLRRFQPYSNLPATYNDISFWIPNDQVVDNRWLEENDFYELARDVGGNWIESIELKDTFYHPKRKQHSRMYRIWYSPDTSMKDPSELTKISNETHKIIGETIVKWNHVELR